MIKQHLKIHVPPEDWNQMVCAAKLGGEEPVTLVEAYLKKYPRFWKRLQKIKGGKKAVEYLVSELSRSAGRDG